MKKLHDQVIACLEDMPETRNSDITLTIAIWRRFYPQYVVDGSVQLSDLYTLPREDNIKRVRAKLNADGKYYPSILEVALHRRIKEDDWRKFMGYPILPREEVKTMAEPALQPEQPAESQTLFGFDVKTNPKVPMGEIHFLRPDGRRR